MLKNQDFIVLRNRSVRRMLWRVDHEQTKADLRREAEQNERENSAKYNFDFKNGRPLKGNLEWSIVDPETPISSPTYNSSSAPEPREDAVRNSSVRDTQFRPLRKVSTTARPKRSSRSVKTSSQENQKPCLRRNKSERQTKKPR